MATLFRQAKDPGFGEKYSSKTKRIINKDGSFNVTRKGNEFQARHIYQELIGMSWLGFFGIVVGLYTLANTLFALAYMAIGIDQLNLPQGSFLENFANAFFFSAQTFTTVGYGAVHPTGVAANFVAAFEAMAGLLGFAFATGLLYGRFSRPSTKILFSKKALVAPGDGGADMLQFRIVNQRKNVLMEMEASALLMLHDQETQTRKYYTLNLETPRIKFFPLNWTIVHPIDETSPLKEMNEKEFMDCDAEILILIKGFDETFSQVVHARHSYKSHEVVWGAKFVKAFYTDEEGEIILEMDKIHDYEKIEVY